METDIEITIGECN